MKIELLYFEGCPHTALAEARLAEAIAGLAPGTAILRVPVETEADAQATGFLGSPSIRVEGWDVEGRSEQTSSLACRVYPEGEGAPPAWMIEAALLRALRPRHLLFMCVANSARSQMAEALARALAPPEVRISSAGSVPTSVRPEALEALAELGLNASAQRSKAADAVDDPESVDAVVTLCAEEVCPTWLGPAWRLHWGLPDPAAVTDPEARREAFRSVRDALQRRLALLFS